MVKDFVITREMIERGYNRGIVQLVKSDVQEDCNTTLCKIGGYEFNFDIFNTEGVSPEEYIKHNWYNDIIDEIYNALSALKKEFENEYLYYYWYLKENLKSEQIGV